MKRESVKSPRSARRDAGFTMVELLVGMVVGLIATVVMFQVFAVSEGQKRTTTGAGDAQQNGVGSVFLIERDARMAGYGVSLMPAAGCWVNGYYEPANQPFAFRLAPYEIRDGGLTPDTLTIVYGDSRAFTAPERMNQDMPSGGAPIGVWNRYGFTVGDLFIVAEEGQPCTMFQVSKVPVGDVNNEDKIHHVPDTFVDAKGQTRRTDFNRGGGNEIMMPGYSAPIQYKKWKSNNNTTSPGGRVMNLGQNPTVITYALQGSQLIARNTMRPGADPILISDGIVQFQAQYAWDSDPPFTPGYGTVPQNAPSRPILLPALGDQWIDSMPPNPTNAMWKGVVGIRFAIVSRSITPERPDQATGVCNATTANPRWLAAGVDLDVTADPNWRCYRYRVFELTVPARNLMWLPDEDA